jgi:uncharacterized protein (DUF3820 family)
MTTVALSDQDPMPFGKYLGEPMEKVPAGYLLYLWGDCGFWKRDNFKDDRVPNTKHGADRMMVTDYIVKNFSSLETECQDKIIQHRP